MRLRHAPLVALAACASSSSSVRRTLVTDDVHAGEARADVIAWHDAHGWCRGETGARTDEFTACHVALLDRGSPAVETRIYYRDDRVIGIALDVPVPCRVSGPCDRPAMQHRLFDALAAELVARYGPAEREEGRSELLWRTADEIVVLGVARGGGSIGELHAFIRGPTPR